MSTGYISRTLILTMLCTSILLGCGQDSPSTIKGGLVGGKIGGNFYKTDFSPYQGEFVSAEFVRVRRPKTRRIMHEFVGVKVHLSSGSSMFFITGLVEGQPDENYFLHNHNRFAVVAKVSDFQTFDAIKTDLDLYFDRSPFHSRRAINRAMRQTPWRGQPCANVTADVIRILRKHVQ